MANQEKDVVQLFWTGGWDSTFRLCQLLICHGKKVQPHYLIDSGRKSVSFELEAQKRITDLLRHKFPSVNDLLFPTIVIKDSNLKNSSYISELYHKVCDITPFGSQYEWLANYCYSNKIINLELSTEKVDGHPRWEFFKKHMDPTLNLGLNNFAVRQESNDDIIFEFFKYFMMPLFQTTRHDMVEISEKYDFYDILHMTWFCHTPIHGRACGLCNPCKDVIKYGFGYRIGHPGLTRNRVPFMYASGIRRIIGNFRSEIRKKN